MKKLVLIGAMLAAMLFTTAADAHWGHRYGGWHGGWHGGWGGAGWHGVGWRGGWGWGGGAWNAGWGWGGSSWGWGPSVWTRRSIVFYPQTYVQPAPVFYPSPVIYGGYGGCWLGDAGVIEPGFVSIGAPAVYAPAGIAYGPDAVKEFMGVDRDFAKGPLVAERAPLWIDAPAVGSARVVDAPRGALTPALSQNEREKVASRPEAKNRAERYISVGDSQFGEQQYHAAAQRYREAAVAAPDVADTHFRQGFAYIASNRFELAARAFRRGLEIDPLWVNSSFRIDELYGRNRLAKDSHLEHLAQSALADRDNADYYFLLGLMLHFDGQTERAKKFFHQAEKLSPAAAAHVEAFLIPPAPSADDAV